MTSMNYLLIIQHNEDQFYAQTDGNTRCLQETINLTCVNNIGTDTNLHCKQAVAWKVEKL